MDETAQVHASSYRRFSSDNLLGEFALFEFSYRGFRRQYHGKHGLLPPLNVFMKTLGKYGQNQTG